MNSVFKFVPVRRGRDTIYVGAHHVTWEVWWTFTFWPISMFCAGKWRYAPVTGKTPPQISRFIQRLNKKSGGYFRLMRMPEWDHLAAGIRRTAGCLTDEDILQQAWCLRNAHGEIKHVGLKDPTLHGVHDLMGNIWDPVHDVRGEVVLKGGCASDTLDVIEEFSVGSSCLTLDGLHKSAFRRVGIRLVSDVKVANIAPMPTEQWLHSAGTYDSLVRLRAASESILRGKSVRNLDEIFAESDRLIAEGRKIYGSLR